MNNAARSDRIAQCVSRFSAACVRGGHLVTSDGRVSETAAAALLGLHPGSLKNMRSHGTGPAFYRRPIAGCRVSYELADIAAWLESRRVPQT